MFLFSVLFLSIGILFELIGIGMIIAMATGAMDFSIVFVAAFGVMPIIFFVIAVLGVMVMMGLMGIGLLFIPVFIAIDIGVFLTTIIPEEICALNLIMNRKISAGKFILYLIGNCIYVVDVVLAVLIHRDFKKSEEGVLT